MPSNLMDLLIPAIFVLGYAAIAFEHPLRINKAASALLTGFLVWTFCAINMGGELASKHLVEHMGDISSILFFLLGAMTIVEMIDVHDGFQVLTDRTNVRNKIKLYWFVGLVTFFLSAVLDNMTTAIVMSALLRKLIKNKEDLWKLAGVVILAANAGGAWSPIGDVTTIMLWIGGQVSTWNIILKLLLPSLACLVVPLLWLTATSRGNLELNAKEASGLNKNGLSKREKYLVLSLGLGALLFVPVFKSYTDLPPFVGLLGGLGIMWITTELLHQRHPNFSETRHQLVVTSILRRVDVPSVIFFLGILMAVAGLETAGYLESLASFLDSRIDNVYAVNVLIGGLSAVVDNVPLVAASMGMYPLDVYPTDHIFWELLALCAGTGGSMLIIGSAAGVAVMGILGIDFVWYMKKIGPLAILGYLAGIATFWLMN